MPDQISSVIQKSEGLVERETPPRVAIEGYVFRRGFRRPPNFDDQVCISPEAEAAYFAMVTGE